MSTLKTVTTRIERPETKALVIAAVFVNPRDENSRRPVADIVYNRDLPEDLVVPLRGLRMAMWVNNQRREGSQDPAYTISVDVTPEEFERIRAQEEENRAAYKASKGIVDTPKNNQLPL